MLIWGIMDETQAEITRHTLQDFSYRAAINFQKSVFLKALTTIDLEFTKWYLSPCCIIFKNF